MKAAAAVKPVPRPDIKLASPSDIPKLPFRPSADKLVILRDAQVERTPGGLFIPDAARTDRKEGIVVSAGKGRWSRNAQAGDPRARRLEPSVRPGDRVFWSKHAGDRFPVWDLVFKDEKGRDRVIVTMYEDALIGIERDGQFHPLFNHVFVKRETPKEDEFIGSLLVPDVAKKPKCEGVIFAIGPGGWDDNGVERLLQTTAKVGDRIVWEEDVSVRYDCLQRFAGKGEEVLTLMDHEVQCVIEHEPPYDPT